MHRFVGNLSRLPGSTTDRESALRRTHLLGDASRGGLVHRPEEILQRRLLSPHHLEEGQLALALHVHFVKDGDYLVPE